MLFFLCLFLQKGFISVSSVSLRQSKAYANLFYILFFSVLRFLYLMDSVNSDSTPTYCKGMIFWFFIRYFCLNVFLGNWQELFKLLFKWGGNFSDQYLHYLSLSLYLSLSQSQCHIFYLDFNIKSSTLGIRAILMSNRLFQASS